MKPISEYAGEKLLFTQPSAFKRIHELRINDTLLATMQQKGFFGMRWDVSIQNKNWEIYKPSIWRTIMEIREAGYEMPFASFTKERFKARGVVSLSKGEIIKIEPHLFKGFCEIKNAQDECLARIKPKTSLKDKAEVTIEKRSGLLDQYPWIIMMAYIITIEQRHQAAHTAG